MPSGSGSINASDLRSNLDDTAVENMNRELREECGIAKKTKIETKLIAYGRFVNRGMKPDFFRVSFIDCTKDELNNDSGDGELVDKAFIKIDDVERLAGIIHQYDDASSIQLSAYSHFFEFDYIKDFISSKFRK